MWFFVCIINRMIFIIPFERNMFAVQLKFNLFSSNPFEISQLYAVCAFERIFFWDHKSNFYVNISEEMWYLAWNSSFYARCRSPYRVSCLRICTDFYRIHLSADMANGFSFFSQSREQIYAFENVEHPWCSLICEGFHRAYISFYMLFTRTFYDANFNFLVDLILQPFRVSPKPNTCLHCSSLYVIFLFAFNLQ